MYNYDIKEERGERRQLKNQIITHPKFYIQGSTYLFRSDPQEGMVGERCKSPPPSYPQLGFWVQNAIQIQENSVQFNTFWSKI